jgi:hypothetical protein
MFQQREEIKENDITGKMYDHVVVKNEIFFTGKIHSKNAIPKNVNRRFKSTISYLNLQSLGFYCRNKSTVKMITCERIMIT